MAPYVNGYGKLGCWLFASGVWAKLTGAAKGVLAVLSYHANGEGEAWPSIGMICRENGSEKKATMRGLRQLGAYRMIEAVGTQARTRGVVRYRLNVDAPADLWDHVSEHPRAGSSRGPKTPPSERIEQVPRRDRVPGPKKGPTTRAQIGTTELIGRGTMLRGTSASLRSSSKDLRAAPGAPAREQSSAMKETARAKGRTTASSSGVPDSFLDWLSAFADVFGKRYTPTSKLGREWAARYAAVVAERKATPDDLTGILPLAKAKRDRGFRLAESPRWILGDGLEELLAERSNGHGRQGGGRTGVEPPGFCHSPTPWS